MRILEFHRMTPKTERMPTIANTRLYSMIAVSLTGGCRVGIQQPEMTAVLHTLGRKTIAASA